MVKNLQQQIKQMFSGLTFEDRRHLYFWYGERVPKSVSALVEHFVEPFDIKKWAPICASKERITEHEMIHKWQTTNKKACDLGTETHDFLEHYNGLVSTTTEQQKAGVRYLKDLLSEVVPSGGERRYSILFKELRMYSKRFNFAGTADLILFDHLTNSIVIADYKTNGDLFKTYGWLKPPFEYLEGNPFNHYQLQLSYYQILLEELNLPVPVSERNIVYLRANGEYEILSTFNFTEQLKQLLIAKQSKNAA